MPSNFAFLMAGLIGARAGGPLSKAETTTDMMTETAPASSEDGRCPLCDRPFQARRTGGTPKKFCSPAHRNAFHTAARKWAEKAVADGRITLDDLKHDPAACTLLPAAFSLSPVPEALSQGAVPQALADEAAQQDASREIPAKICAAKNPGKNSEENLVKPPVHTPAR